MILWFSEKNKLLINFLSDRKSRLQYGLSLFVIGFKMLVSCGSTKKRPNDDEVMHVFLFIYIFFWKSSHIPIIQ